MGAAERRSLLGLAERCAGTPELHEAIRSGALPLARAEALARVATAERARFLPESLDALLRASNGLPDGEDFIRVLRRWAERCDEHLQPRRVLDHRLHLVPRLFGGGEVHGSLPPSAFHTVAAALDAFDAGPDPQDAPYVRTAAERRADALDDLAHHALTHACEAGDVDDEAPPDGWTDLDDLDRAMAEPGLDDLGLARRRIRAEGAAVRRRERRRVRPRSGATVSVTIDLRTLGGRSEPWDLDDIDVRAEGWHLATCAAERFLCDARLSAVLLAGRRGAIDANPAAERFSTTQRRAIAARDGCCAFPGCRRPPKHCDTHHPHPRAEGGPTTTRNGILLCRFHHRLVHEAGWSLHFDEHAERWIAVDRWDDAHAPPDGRTSVAA